MIYSQKGSILVLTAILLPGLIAFWGWIISGALLLNAKITQQIASDSAVISGAEYAIVNSIVTFPFLGRLFIIPVSNAATTNRTLVVFRFHNPNVTPTVTASSTLTNSIFSATVSISSTMNKSLFIAPDATFTTKAAASSKSATILFLSYDSILKPLQ